jgi:integrase
MPQKNLTDPGIKNLKKPKDKPQIDYWDTQVKGLGMRVGAKGTKTFNVQLRVLSGGSWKNARIKLGTYPALGLKDARETARDYMDIAKRGEDPRQIKTIKNRDRLESSRNTFAYCRESFLKARSRGGDALSASSQRQYRRVLEHKVDFGDWENRPISKITTRDVVEVRNAIRDRGAETMANRTLAYLRKMFNWCVDEHILEVNPCLSVKRAVKEVPRTRILNNNEIVSVWRAFESTGGDFEVPFKLMLLLGQREDEVVGMRRSELTTWKGILGPKFKEDSQYSDFKADDMAWVIPADRTKKNREHIVAIPETARVLLEGVQSDSNLLFTNDAKRPEKEKRPLSGFGRVKARINEDCGFDDWVLHDLRRTLRSGLARLGFPSEVGKKVINHKLTGMDAVYDQYEYLPQRRRALMAWADYVESLLTESDKTNIADLSAERERRA